MTMGLKYEEQLAGTHWKGELVVRLSLLFIIIFLKVWFIICF